MVLSLTWSHRRFFIPNLVGLYWLITPVLGVVRKKWRNLDLSKFDLIRVSKKIPELRLMLWISHDKPIVRGKLSRHTDQPTIRMTSVSILTPVIYVDETSCKWDGVVFTGVSGCSELDTFEKKDGFNRAYGRACQKLVNWHLCSKLPGGRPNKLVDLILYNVHDKDIKDMNGWISKHAFQAKLEFAQRVFQARLAHKPVPVA